MTDNKAAIAQRLMEKIHSQELPLAQDSTVRQAKYINAVLNSSLGRLFLRCGDTIPIPNIAAAEQEPFVKLVDKILEAKAADANADTRHLERAIDELVYEL